MPLVYVGVGSNEGNRLQNLLAGISLIGRRHPILAVSSIYLTEAQGFVGRDFLNAVLLIRSNDNPFSLLRFFKDIEGVLGRRGTGYGPRPFDADILLYEGLTLRSPDLTVPHPRMWERDFVLLPLKELFSLGFPTLSYTVRPVGRGRVIKVIDRRALRVERL